MLWLIALLVVSVVSLPYPDRSGSVDSVARCESTKGSFEISLYRDWAPLGYDRFIQLVQHNYYHNIALFRVIKNFIVQFGISTDPEQIQWANQLGNVKDDPSILPNRFCEGCISFAGGGKDSRGYQAFIATKESDWLGRDPWETPFGVVTEGLEVVRSFYDGYGDHAPNGKAPDQGRIHAQGENYLLYVIDVCAVGLIDFLFCRKEFPKLDYLKSCSVVDTSSNQDDLLDLNDDNAKEIEVEGENIVRGLD
jgi:peptidyl-prolyl cis-trans isomerase A (cyclophilin A)